MQRMRTAIFLLLALVPLAAFGLAVRGWNQGWSIGVFQFVKSAKWRIGEQTVLETLGELHAQTGQGGDGEKKVIS